MPWLATILLFRPYLSHSKSKFDGLEANGLLNLDNLSSNLDTDSLPEMPIICLTLSTAMLSLILMV